MDAGASLVADSVVCDLILLTALAGDELALFLVPSQSALIEPLDPIDGRATAHITLTNVVLSAGSRLPLELADIEGLRDLARVCCATVI